MQISNRLVTLFMIFVVASAGIGAFAGGATATVTATGDLAGDGTDLVEGFAADGEMNDTVTYETTAETDTLEDLEELSLTVDYDNNTVAEYDQTDAEVISGDDDDVTVLEVEFQVDHDDLEQLPGDAGEITTADYTITELEDADAAEEVTEEFSVDYEFDTSYAAVTAFSEDDSITSFDEGEDGMIFGWGAEAASTEISDDVGVNGTETDVHVHASDSTLVDTFDDSVESADAGDRVGLLMTSTLDGQAIVVFNEEPGEFIGGDEADEDEDTYAVYHGDGHTEINLGDDRYDDADDEVSVNMVSGVDVGSSVLQDDLGYSWFQANGLSLDVWSLSDITDSLQFW